MFSSNFRKLNFCHVSKDNIYLSLKEDIDAIFVGDDLLEKATRYYETIDMNMVWEIIDWYKQAILLARELDIEQEALF